MPFASIFVPHFPVQAVVRAEPALRGSPLALIEGVPPLAKITEANDAARQAGIEPGMNKANAAHFSAVQIRPRSPAQEQISRAALLDLGWSISPRIEDTAPGAVTVDIAGLASVFGSRQQIAGRLAQRALECGFEVHVAVAENIEAAHVAARGFAGITVIDAGEESLRLSSLPIHTLSPSLQVAETLDRWGVRTCAALAALPLHELSERLGQEGVRLHALARGDGRRALSIAEPVYSFEEEIELDDAVEELDPLSFLLGRLLDQLCARLEARAQAATSLQILFDLQPAFEKAFDRRQELTRSKISGGVYRSELRLPVASRHPKMLLQLLRLRLQGNPPGAPIVKIRIAAQAGRPRATQGGLFLPAYPDAAKLEITLARLANIVGAQNVGSPQPADTHRPGHFLMHAFLPPQEIPEKGRARSAAAAAKSINAAQPAVPQSSAPAPAPVPAAAASATFRVFRPPLPANLQLQSGRPIRIFFQGAAGAVLAASGPWRTSGEWWREDRWEHDEWDVEIAFSDSSRQSAPNEKSRPQPFSARRAPRNAPARRGLYRIFFDSLRGGWFVRGCYD
jgi:protein ImuB